MVIAHRGASGYRPEHTLAAYELAIEQGADFIEPDLVLTGDGELVARHESEIGATTDVGDHPEFASRFTTKMVDGNPVSGWFTEDFTLSELKTLTARERIPGTRPRNTVYHGRFEIPTLAEVLRLASRSRTHDGRAIGVYMETKHPSHFAALGLSMNQALVAALHEHGYRSRSSSAYIQSFEVANLRDIAGSTDVRLIQLVGCRGAPRDFEIAGDGRTYSHLLTPPGLDVVASYADGIGVCKDRLIPRRASGDLGQPTRVVDDAHARGLQVHAWTFRSENQFLPTSFRSNADPQARGDMEGEVRAFLDAGVDGIFTDQPDLGRAAADERPASRNPRR